MIKKLSAETNALTWFEIPAKDNTAKDNTGKPLSANSEMTISSLAIDMLYLTY